MDMGAGSWEELAAGNRKLKSVPAEMAMTMLTLFCATSNVPGSGLIASLDERCDPTELYM